MPESIDVVLLDLDGTLTDAAPGIINCIVYALDDMGMDHPAPATMCTFLGPPLADTFGRRLGMTPDQVDYAIEKYRERYHDLGLYENTVYDGIPELLASLDEAGIVLAIATSKPTYSATRILEHFGLAERLAFIGGADLAGERHDKAAVIAHTLEELAAIGRPADPARTRMVGDREHDVLGAQAHGIGTVGVLWGYGSAEELTSAGATDLVATPAELAALLTR